MIALERMPSLCAKILFPTDLRAFSAEFHFEPYRQFLLREMEYPKDNFNYMNKVVLNFYGHHKCATQWIIGILNNIAIASGYSLFHAMERAHFSLMDLKSIDKSKNVIVILVSQRLNA